MQGSARVSLSFSLCPVVEEEPRKGASFSFVTHSLHCPQLLLLLLLLLAGVLPPAGEGNNGALSLLLILLLRHGSSSRPPPLTDLDGTNAAESKLVFTSERRAVLIGLWQAKRNAPTQLLRRASRRPCQATRHDTTRQSVSGSYVYCGIYSKGQQAPSARSERERGGDHGARARSRLEAAGGRLGMEKMMLHQQEQQEARAPASACPPWLQAAIADIEQRVRALAAGVPDDDAAAAAADHSFAERAENYYHRRPQLLALLTDLHHRYLYLADRYAQSLLANAKSSAHFHSHHLNLNLNAVSGSDCSSDVDDRSSDAGSSLSFQPHSGITDDHFATPVAAPAVDRELVVAELVMAWVDRDVLADEADRRRAESARKIDLQGSLLEVLESERLVLLGENARLAFRASAAEEEAAAAAAELGYTRRRAADMARLAVKLRDDHRACMLGRKVEALQAQVYGLELRNRECFEAMAAWEAERKAGVAEIERLRAENRRLAAEAAQAAASSRRKRGGGKGGGSGWWWLARVRLAAEWTPCAPSSVTVRKVGEQMKGGKYNGGCFCL